MSKPTLTIRYIETGFGDDVSGTLYDENGQELYSHTSSNTSWLKRDLTDGFTDRRLELEARYPEGYEVVMTSQQPSADEELARLFHDTYERLAPEYGYETRQDTKQFDPTTSNGKLMIAVAHEVNALIRQEKRALLDRLEKSVEIISGTTDSRVFVPLAVIQAERDKL